MKGFLARGRDDALQELLVRTLVHCAVTGVAERAGELEIWLADDSPPPPACEGTTLLPDPPVASSDWRRGDRAIAIRPDLLVRPPWVPVPPGFRGLELVVPRGMAFGSGEDESTQLALGLLHDLLPGAGSFADAGTGSGILLHYAARRGCAPLRGCDIDEAAVRAAAALVPGAHVALGGPDTLLPHGTVDHVAANMMGRELLGCLTDLVALWNRRGVLMLSGIRHHERAAVLAAVPAHPSRVLTGSRFTAAAWTDTEPPGDPE